MFAPTDLCCNYLSEPLGIDTTEPTLSWKIPCLHNGMAQTAYEVQVASTLTQLQKGKADLWQSGRVDSRQQVGIVYAGKALRSRQLCYWRVRVWDERGKRSHWSQPTRFAVGVLDMMRGQYIGRKADSEGVQSPLLRTSFTIGNVAEPVFLHVNSLGYHEVFVNGRSVTARHPLQPAMSQLDKHSQIVAYDITPYLQKGGNDLVVWAGQGWYKATTFKAQHPGALVKAEVNKLVGGVWQPVAQTDATWLTADSGRRDTGTWYAHQFGGERVDGRVEPQTMDKAELDKRAWEPAVVVDVQGMTATPQAFAGNSIVDRLQPKTIVNGNDNQASSNAVIVDFGRIITGWLQVKFNGLSEGDEVRMEYADYIPVGGQFESQGEADEYIANGHSDVFTNKFNHHAFRYVRLSRKDGQPLALHQSDLSAVQISALAEKGSTFKCSDERLNMVHDMIHYTMRCLTFSGYMVDCPHLERMGYGGDGNSSTMTLQTMYEVDDTYRNWLSAWIDTMDDDGSLPHVAPAGGGGGGPYWCGFIIKAPLRAYLNYGDLGLLEKCYPKMQQWLGYVDQHTVDGLLQRWPDTKNRVWFLGDWLAPAGVDVGGASVIHANNCFISDCLNDMAAIARLLHRDADARQYESKRNELNRRIHETFYHADTKTYANGTPLDMAYAMLAGVVPQDLYAAVSQRLIDDSYGKYNSHIAVGLFGVPIFTEWAVKNRKADLMATILRQPDYPGYLHMIANGATATWESWNADRSRVHNCYNGIGTWFYQSLAGMRHTPFSVNPSDDGAFIIEPEYPEGVDWVEASRPTPYGPLQVCWKKINGQIEYDIDVPVGLTVQLRTPSAAEGILLGAGHHKF